MKRRRVIQMSGVAGIGALGGCLSVQLDDSAPVDLEIWNDTDDSHTVSVTITDGDGETVLDESYDVEPRGSRTTPGGPDVRESGFTEAAPDEHFDVVAFLDDALRYESQFEASCVTEETPDEFLIEIEPGRETSLQFDQSTCS